MWKKLAFVVAGLLAAIVLITGLTAVTYADTAGKQGNRPPGGGPPFGEPFMNSDVLTRVAEILKIDKQQLSDAFKQAGTEMRQKGTDAMFSKWVTEGKLTQEQANQYKAWMASKPAGVRLMNMEMADKLLNDGKITQAQYDAFKAWIAQKPNVELPKPEKPANAPQRGACDNTNKTK